MDYFAPINGNPADPNRPYVNADPGNSIEGSWPHAKAIEGSMREILHVIEQAGITPDDEDFTQLYEAIVEIVNPVGEATETAAGVVELTTGTEALGGTDNTRAVTSAALASSKLYAGNGYQRFPGGLIIQWGNYTSTSLVFPVAFPAAARGVLLTDTDSTENVSSFTNLTVNGCTVHGDNSGFFIAIGN